jgi:NAD(P)-dependent dehydrogenase (short-subunit alcohol dehydrogenase family)
LGTKVAVVTGSCIGLGAAIARRLAADGARVVVTGYPVERGEKLAAEIGGIFVKADLLKVDETKALIRTTIEKLGGVDVLVNNAAVSERAGLEEVTPEIFDRQFHLIVRAPILLAQAALPSLKERTGVIVNIASVNAHIGWQNLLCYASAKAALVTASKNLANALKYARVRVHCVNPGWIDTEGERSMMAKLGHPADFLDAEGKKLPLGRLMKPEEVADAVGYLASDRAAAFSGTVLDLEQFPLGAMAHPLHTEPMQ